MVNVISPTSRASTRQPWRVSKRSPYQRRAAKAWLVVVPYRLTGPAGL
jgi:hypothetical protein